MRILVITRSYPAAGDLYKYPFVHRRVVAYSAAGHEVRVFRPAPAECSDRVFDGVSCRSGGTEALIELVGQWPPDVIAVHGFAETMWDYVAPVVAETPVRAWLHGSEIPEFMRQKALAVSEEDRPQALRQVRERCDFWSRLLADLPPLLKLVFVSRASVELARKDWGVALRDKDFSVIANPIDTELFEYREKRAADVFNVLLIRPFDSHTYANDLAVAAVQKLLQSPESGRFRFTIIGDGPLFEKTLNPLAGHPQVVISRRFLRQQEIAEMHRRNGLFLVPTRLDTQGVSRDEAMSSGLVPVTNGVEAVLEFVDDECAAIAPPGDSDRLAGHILEMAERPQLFLDRSRAAASRIRADRSNALLIPRELALLEEAVRG